jgi:hypothetical protein
MESLDPFSRPSYQINPNIKDTLEEIKEDELLECHGESILLTDIERY